MWKAAFLVLAASLMFPLLASWAASPEDSPAAASDGSIPILPRGTEAPVAQVIFDLQAGLLPAKDGEELPDEMVQELEDLHTRHLEWRRLQDPAPARRSVCLAAGGVPRAGQGNLSLCDFGAAVSQMKPCLAARDCPAVEAWRQAMGQMGVRPAPQTMTRATVRSATRFERPEPERD